MTNLLTFKRAVAFDNVDTEKRTVRGLAVPWDEIGITDIGPTVFKAGSISEPSNPVHLVTEHYSDKPLGKAKGWKTSEKGLEATFKLVETTVANDALVEASEGLRSGLSVGVNATEADWEDGVYVIRKAELVHVGLVVTPAFESARVEIVNATKGNEPMENESTQETTTETASEPNKGNPVPIVAASPPETPSVSAADRPLKPLTTGGYLKHMVLASRGNEASKRRINAALAVDTTTTVPGVVPTEQASEIIGIVDSSRPAIDSIEKRNLPATGMKFQVPYRVSHAGVELVDEGSEVYSNASDIQYRDVSVKYFKGANEVSIELIERSDPSFLDDLLTQFAQDYAQMTDWYVIDQMLTGAVASDATDMYGSVIKGIADSAGVARTAPAYFLMSLDVWAKYKGDKASDGRPTFPYMSPRNAAGSLGGTSLSGDIEGLTAFVDMNAGAATEIVYPSNAYRYYEDSATPVQVRAVQVSTMKYEIGVYGAVAVLPKWASAVRKLTQTP